MEALTEQEQPVADMPREAPPPSFVRRHPVAIGLTLVGLVLLALIVRGVRHRGQNGGFPGAQNNDDKDAPVAVSVATVGTGDIQVRIAALGTITPLATVTVRTQISGMLTKIAFTEGQLVHAGDFLAQIDPRPYEAALKQNEGTLRRDEALLANAKLDLTRYKDLIKDDAVSAQQLDQQKALVEQYEGTVETDRAQVTAAQVNLSYTHITAPVTGRVGLRQVDSGNYVTPADATGIVVITQLEPITAIFPVPEDDVAPIVRRLSQKAILPVEAYDRSNSAQLAVGKLLTLDNQIDTTTGTVKLRALFDNHDGALFPNQFVNIELLQDVLHDQTVMPNAAVRRGAPNGVVTTFVYLVRKDHTVAVRPVTLGVLDGERVAVTNGLTVGDQVVTDGGDRLRDGASVVLPGEAAPAVVASNGNGQRSGGGWRGWRKKKAASAQSGSAQSSGAAPAPAR